MSVAPEDFLAEARTLAKRTDEMGIRLTINRAYYGAFHLAKAVAPLIPGYQPSNRDQGSHQEVLNWFATAKTAVFPGCTQAKQIYKTLSESKKLRQRADYLLADLLEPQQARAVLNNAQTIQRLIAEFEIGRAHV